MPTTCGFPACKFRSRYRQGSPVPDNRHFYRVPKKPAELRLRWLTAIGRTEETIVSQLRVCSGHFPGGVKHEGDIPVADPAVDAPQRIELPAKSSGSASSAGGATPNPNQSHSLLKGEKRRSSSSLASSAHRRLAAQSALAPASANSVISTLSLSPASSPTSSSQQQQQEATQLKPVSALFPGALGFQLQGVQPGIGLSLGVGGGQEHLLHTFLQLVQPASPPSTSSPDEQSSASPRTPSTPSEQLPPKLLRLASDTATANCTTLADQNGMNMNMNVNHAMPLIARPAAGVAPGGGPTSLAPSQRPLVALLDGRDCSVEMPILKDVATVAFCDAHDVNELHERVLAEAKVALVATSTLRLRHAELTRFRALRLVVRLSKHADNIDVAAAAQLGIAVSTVAHVGVEEAADTALAHLLALCRRTVGLALAPFGAPAAGSLRDVGGAAADGGSGSVQPTRIRGQTLGIVGLGRVGTAVAIRAKAFGFNVLFYDPNLPEGAEHSLGVVRLGSLEELLAASDCVTLHCGLGNRHLFSERAIRLMRHGAYLVNVSHSELVDEAALVAALREGRLRGAALDSFQHDPFAPPSAALMPSVALRECVQEGVLLLTPQVAHACEQYASEARQAAAAEVRRAALALAQSQAHALALSASNSNSPGSGSLSGPGSCGAEWTWLDALHGCVNRAALLAAVRERAVAATAVASSSIALDLKQAALPLPVSLTKGMVAPAGPITPVPLPIQVPLPTAIAAGGAFAALGTSSGSAGVSSVPPSSFAAAAAALISSISQMQQHADKCGTHTDATNGIANVAAQLFSRLGSFKPQAFNNVAPLETQAVPTFTRAASTPVRENTTAPKSLALDRDEFKMDMKLTSLSPVRELKVRTNGGGSSVVSATMTWMPPVGRLSPTTNTVSILEQPENRAAAGTPTSAVPANGYKRHRQPTPPTAAAGSPTQNECAGGAALEVGAGFNLGAKDSQTLNVNEAGQLLVGDEMEGSASEVVTEAAPVEASDVEAGETREEQCSDDDEDGGHLMIAVASDAGVPLSLSPLPNTVIGITCPEAGLEIRDN